jgi:hypothetical protein
MSGELPIGSVLSTPPEHLPAIGDLVGWYHGPYPPSPSPKYPTMGIVITSEEISGVCGLWVAWSDSADPMWSPTMMLKIIE